MTAGPDLLGGTPAAPRKRGRPKGSKNRRAADLKGWIEARTGGSAAQQSADLCLVTVREVKAAGGDVGRALMAKAAAHVRAFKAAQVGLDEEMRALVREELEALVETLPGEEPKEVRKAVLAMFSRLRAPGSALTLKGALQMMAEERRALLPYTDQRQPQLVDVKGQGFAPAVIVQGGIPGGHLIEGQAISKSDEGSSTSGMRLVEVSPTRSHDEG